MEHMANLRSLLYAWRDDEAAKKGIDLFRVLPNSSIDEIVRALPTTKEELIAIKGIKDAKFLQYGAAILRMVKESTGASSTLTGEAVLSQPDHMRKIGEITPERKVRTLYSVSTYLDIVNRELSRMRATVKGEVTSFKAQGKAVYFSIRDAEDGSTLSVFMWLSDFILAGIELTDGLEVIIEGRSEVYKPSGRLSFRADTIELVGEGAFKQAYEELKKKLLQEGLFDPTKKRTLKDHPVRIGLVTSRQGAVIHDFLNNLGKFGYQITFLDSRVEGAMAVKDILSALKHLETKELDVLVVIRGGGSLESLQAFNNEHVVRAIAGFPAVTLCAIGHDKDVPLAQLVADYAPSTPTATTIILNASWENLTHELELATRTMLSLYEQSLWLTRDTVSGAGQSLEHIFDQLIKPFRVVTIQFNELILGLARRLATPSAIRW